MIIHTLFISNYLKCHNKFSEELYLLMKNVEKFLPGIMGVYHLYNTLRNIKNDIEKIKVQFFHFVF